MVDIYTNKGGMSPPDATLVIDTLLRYPRFFIDNMVVWELGLLPLTKDFSVLRGREGGREGGIRCVSSITCSSSPLSLYSFINQS